MHIFISYAKKDSKELALKLRDIFNSLHPTVTAWMDESLESGGSWARQIEREINKCDLLIILLSPDVNREETETQDRSFVLNEVDYAIYEARKPALTVMAQKTRLPVQLAGEHYYDFTENQEAGIAKLVAEICERANLEVPLQYMPKTKVIKSPRERLKLADSKQRNIMIGSVMLAVLLIGSMVLYSIFANEKEQPLVEAGDVGTKPPPLALLNQIPQSEALQKAIGGVSANHEWIPYSEEINAVEMVLVPKGCFLMGGEEGAFPENPPIGQVCFDAPFWIDRYEVTNAQFNQFNGQAEFESDRQDNNHPREMIDWYEAYDFCEKRYARLPSGKEWEYAARGPSSFIYPWGNKFVADNVVYKGNSNNQTAPVGSRPLGASWVGALDMSGNVWEWVSSSYLRGGSLRDSPTYVETFRSDYYQAHNEIDSVGFRCARDFE